MGLQVREQSIPLGNADSSSQLYSATRHFSVERMKLLKIPQKRPQYRRDRHHESFLTSLSSHARPDVKSDRHVYLVE